MTDGSRARDPIRVHSEQASLFSERYETLTADPYGSCFAYSRRRLQVLLDRLLPVPSAPARLLDVGCGTGYHLAWARARGYEAAGVDGSAEMLVEARRLNPNADIRQAGVDVLPFPDDLFDAVLCVEVLRYLPQTEPCIRELARVLKPNGVCLATASPLLNLNGFPLLNRAGLLLPSLGLVRLKQFFHTVGGLRRRFHRAGFREVTVRGVYLGLCNWVEKLAPRGLPRFLRAMEPHDAALSDLPGIRDLSGMLLVHAIR